MAGKHSRWSASASARSMACPGSLALIEQGPPGETSVYAAWGTGMHRVNEVSLVKGIEPSTMLGDVMPIDGFDIVVDDDMVDAAKVCVDYVRALSATAGAQLWLEERFDLAPLGFPLEAGGTSDAVIWLPAARTIEIVDYKGGRGVRVDVNDNTQLAHYGLGAMVKHPELPAELVKMTVIQPRIPDPEGVIRSQVLHVSDLVDFANDIQAAMDLTVRASRTYSEELWWAETYLHTGDHCTFCPAAGTCPALRAKAQDLVGLHWEDQPDGSEKFATLSQMTAMAVERDLEVLDLMEHWISERRAYAHQLAEGGHEFANWMLVERSGHRKWNDKPDDAAAKAIEMATGLSLVEMFDRKLKSPAGIEKVLGKDKGKIEGLFHKPVTGKDLVRRSIGGRQPAKSLVDAFFNSEN